MAELDTQSKNIQTLYGWHSENKLWVNRRYQRKLVWTLEEKQRLIESALKRYPIPALLIAEREAGGYEVIDGLQRLHTIMSFIETSFTTIEGKYFDVAQFVTAKTRATEAKAFEVTQGETLTPHEVGTFLDYPLAISVMRGFTDAEIDDVFTRINMYGHRLSDQERRQSGVRDDFSSLVRQLSCDVRGDASSEVLSLEKMPSISIDLPMTKHGYEVAADEVFWVQQGILRSTDLRDSMDEQCVADITASIINGELIERSKDALDRIYDPDSAENRRIISALDAHGEDRLSAEFKLCIDEIKAVCAVKDASKLRSVIFSKKTTNAFPAAFAVLFVAFYELLFKETKKIADYSGVKTAITNLDKRIETSRGSTAPAERRKNVDTIKALIREHFVDSEPREIYGDHTTTDIDAIIRRSEIEAPHYELKQGIIRLGGNREIDPAIFQKVMHTICAIANNGKGRSGTVLVGVADKEADSERVRALDNVQPRKVGRRFVVGVHREARILRESTERYFARWKDMIRSSGLTSNLKSDVLSSLSHSDYYGLGVILIRIPEQRDVSFVDGRVFIRAGDESVEVTEAANLLEVGRRFQ